MGAFFLPVTAFANAPPESEQAEANQTEETQSSSSQTNQAGSSTQTPNPNEPPRSPWADAPETGNPFTPDGSATVVDNATSDDGKEFFTFTTPEGNVFFLIIDRSRPNNNVYFLNAVTEADLMALAAPSPEPPPVTPLPEPLPPPIPTPPNDEPELPVAPEPEIQSGNNGTLLFVGAAVLAFGGAAYYLKIVRPKQQGIDFDDEEEYEESEEKDSDKAEDLEELYDVEDIIREVREGDMTQSNVSHTQSNMRNRESPPYHDDQ